MIENIKNSIIAENRKLKARVNTLEMRIEELEDETIDKLLNALSRKDEVEEKDKQIRMLEIKNKQLKELIKEMKVNKK